MSGYYTITLSAWPFSTGAGKAAEYERAGPEKREHTVRASDFQAAYEAAQTFQAGVKSSGHIWKAPIRSIVYRGEQRP